MGSLCCTQRHRAHVDYILDDTLAAQPEIEDITQSTTERKCLNLIYQEILSILGESNSKVSPAHLEILC